MSAAYLFEPPGVLTFHDATIDIIDTVGNPSAPVTRLRLLQRPEIIFISHPRPERIDLCVVTNTGQGFTYVKPPDGYPVRTRDSEQTIYIRNANPTHILQFSAKSDLRTVTVRITPTKEDILARPMPYLFVSNPTIPLNQLA